MRYSELLSFEAIESVLKLKDADKRDRAQDHARTFVMSSNLRKQLAGVVFKELQFVQPTSDSKGVFIVGNYGTGKTHLMSVVSAVCEYDDVMPDAEGDEKLLDSMSLCRGRFKVVRIVIGATLRNLRDIICEGLTETLSRIGIEHKFPDPRTINDHEATFQDLMGKVDNKYPGKGLLVVVDELLDYLKRQDEQQLYSDLAFLREIGEICKNTRFRFIAGIQESLFDNPAWDHVAEAVRRVRDRFAQIRIQREDVATVVSRRLLQKNSEQKRWIRGYLDRFSPLYPILVDRMNECVELFPVHPVYLEKFEKIHVAERREVLKTLSAAMKELLDEEVPEDRPGLITFDSYWFPMRNDPTLLANRDVKEVLERTQTLEDKVKQSFPKPLYREAAVRIIHGLGVDRLTTPDIIAPLGMTTAELRDGLLIHVPNLPEQKAEFLEGLVGVILKDTLTTVAGQYISKNEENGQYYIDVKKAIDYDQNIADRATLLTKDQKDASYFDALRKIILENPDLPSYVTGYRIWEYDVPWASRNVDRPGYLFFGAPNERSTAQPPRDFYLYFLQIYDRPKFTDEKKPDEVFYELLEPEDPGFEGPLVRYAAATKLAETQSHARQIYREKAEDTLRELVKWLRTNMPSRCRVAWKGQKKLLQEWQAVVPGPKHEVRDMVDAVASTCLNSHFEDQYPDYPSFEIRLTRSNREEMCKAAVKQIADGSSSKASLAILDGLGLIEEGAVRPSASRYGKPVFDALASKKPGQVLNRGELMDVVGPGHGLEVEKINRVEPDLFAVVLTALCHHGDIVLAYPGEKVDASNVGALVRKTVQELGRFKHVEKPRGIPLGAVMALCRLVGENESLAKDPNLHEAMVRNIQERRGRLLEDVVRWMEWARSAQLLWGIRVLSEKQGQAYVDQLRGLKGFLESLQAFNAPAKLVNLKATEAEIDEHAKSVNLVERLKSREQHASRLGELTRYLESAALLLPENHSWQESVPALKAELAALLGRDATNPQEVQSVAQNLAKAKKEYQDHYLRLHKAARLGPDEEKRRTKLLNSPRLKTLQNLSRISALVDSRRLDQWTEEAAGLKACFSLVPVELSGAPACPHCHFNPSKETTRISTGRLDQLEDELTSMEGGWISTLRTNFADSILSDQIDLLDADQQDLIKEFARTGKLPAKDLDVFVQAAMTVSEGLHAVEIPMDEVRRTLVASGSAGKPDAVKERFKQLLDKHTRGTHPDKVRIVFTDDGEEKE